MAGFVLGAAAATVQSVSSDDAAIQFIKRVLPANAGPGRRIGLFWFPNDEKSWQEAAERKQRRPPTVGRAYNDAEDAVGFMRWALANQHQSGTPYADFYICMSLCGLELTATSKTGKAYTKPARSIEAHRASRTLCADFDVKEGAYASKADAKAALDAAVAAGLLPAPTVVVDSGNGMHVHWVLDRELTRVEWESLAHPFATYLKDRLKLHIDTMCTRDPVRIMRIPGSWNAKDRANPVPTALIGTIDPNDIPVATFEALLGASTASAGSNVVPFRQRAVPVTPHSLPAAFQGHTPFVPVPGAVEFSDGVDPDLHGATPPVDVGKAVAACPTLREIKARGGAGDSEPLWNLAILVASFAPEAERTQWAHDFSRGYQGYNPAEVDAKLAEKVNARLLSGGRIGWPSCRAFSAESPACAACPFFTQGKSPLNQGVVEAPVPVTDLPETYLRDGLSICVTLKTDAGTEETHVVMPHDILDAAIEERGPEGAVFAATILHYHNPPTRITLPLSAANGWREEATKALAAAQITLQPEQLPLARRFFVAFIQKLQRAQANTVVRDPFGWVKSRLGAPGFAFDGRIHTASGTEPAAAPDEHFRARFHAQGDMARWKEAADLVMGMNRVDLQATVATAFAAPLLRFTGENGVIVSAYSPFTGVQKSSAIKVAQAVWGDPRTGLTRLDDTQNAVGKKLGALRHLPVYWDELQRRDQTEAFAKLAFTLTQGTEKSRMSSDTKLRHSGEWATMLVCGSNHSVREIMHAAQAEGSAAGVVRVFEYEVKKVDLDSSAAEAGIILGNTHDNYGLVGVEYAKLLASLHDKIQPALAATSKSFEAVLDKGTEHRFWTAAAATIYLGASLANRLAGGTLIQFPLPELREFLIDTLKHQQAQRREDVTDIGSLDNAQKVVQGYIDFCRTNNTCLETNTVPDQPGRPKLVETRFVSSDVARFLRAPVAHIIHDDGYVRFTKEEFRKWIVLTRKLPFDAVKRDLERYGAMTEARTRWAAGTQWSGALTGYYKIDTHFGRTPLGVRIGHGK